MTFLIFILLDWALSHGILGSDPLDAIGSITSPLMVYHVLSAFFQVFTDDNLWRINVLILQKWARSVFYLVCIRLVFLNWWELLTAEGNGLLTIVIDHTRVVPVQGSQDWLAFKECTVLILIALELRQTPIVVMVLLSRVECLMMLLVVLDSDRYLSVTWPLDLVGFLCSCLGIIDLLMQVVLVVLVELASSH